MTRRSFSVFFFALFLGTISTAATLPPGFTETRVASGLSRPTAMAMAPDGRIFVAEQGGRLRVVKNGSLLATPFLSLTVNSSGERGLLGVAFDPDFAANGFVYVYYTATSPALHNRVSRFTAAGDVAAAGSEVVILDLDNLSGATNHNGGALHFGPDGKLYIAVGENANPPAAQSLSTVLGKILRLNKDGSFPADNPFFATTSGKNRAIWALGLRNPFTFAFQPGSGRMLINDVGQSTWEEINDGIAGSNYGWPATEGPTSEPAFRSPLYWYGRGEGCAITGGAFYNPATRQFPAEFEGDYFFADFCGNWIRRFDPVSRTAADFIEDVDNPVDLLVAPDGSLYYLSYQGGSLFKVEHTGSGAPRITSEPQDVTVPVGGSATFQVAASGTAPLAYRWRRNGADIPGANGPTFRLAAVSAADDGAVFSVVVSNAQGSAESRGATLRVTQNGAPAAFITAPANRTLYRGGQSFTFAGRGIDPQDGNLPPSAFTWRVDFHHDSHTHPFVPPTSGVTSGSFTIPTTGETSANVFYRIHLTVRDSSGATASTSVDLVPRKVTLTLASQPSGLLVTFDGQPVRTPTTVVSVVGIQRLLGVVSPQTRGGTTYRFQSWSDGGAASHTISTPAAATTYRARYVPGGATPAAGVGLAATYFNNASLTAPMLVRLDPAVDFDWGAESPAPGVGADTWSVRWQGQILPKVSGRHTFIASSDDGVRLWVNGAQVINDWTDHAARETSGAIDLVAGRKVDIRIEVYDNLGLASARLSWQAPGLPREVVPRANLFPYALFVTGGAALNPSDNAVRQRLERLGFVPVPRPAAQSRATDAAGKGVIVLSATVNPAQVGARFRTAIVPVVNCEPALFDDLGMTSAAAGSSGNLPNQRQVRMFRFPHPLTGGLQGNVTIASAPIGLSWGRPNDNAVVTARDMTGQRSVLFGYEKGAVMPGLAAPARRVGCFVGDNTATALTPNGWTLFEAAVRWAAGN